MHRDIQPIAGRVARAARERLGLTQAQVAEQVDLVTAVYGRIERGDMTPSVPTLRRLCVVLGISADDFLSLHESLNHDALAERDLEPEIQRIVGQLRTWSPQRLKVLNRVLSVVAQAEEG